MKRQKLGPTLLAPGLFIFGRGGFYALRRVGLIVPFAGGSAAT
jgi:hypothetical protein